MNASAVDSMAAPSDAQLPVLTDAALDRRVPFPAAGALSVCSLFNSNRMRMLVTYVLFGIENLLRLAQPFVVGLAINDLLHSSWRGLTVFVVLHLSHLLVGTIRQMYDTRTFTSIYTELASKIVVEQRQRDVAVSRVAARSALSREFIEFFEDDVPVVIRAGCSIIGGLFMLAYYDWLLVPLCLLLAIPALAVNWWYARRTHEFSRELHDRLENEVDVIEPAQRQQVRSHYRDVATWRIRLSDSEAQHFAFMELFVLAVVAVALVRVCVEAQAMPGDIFAVFRYLMLILMGLDAVPKLVHRMSRLRDIQRRLRVV